MFLRAFAGPSLLCVGRAVLSNSVSYSFQSPHLRSPLDHFPILHVILHKVLGSYHGSLIRLNLMPTGWALCLQSLSHQTYDSYCTFPSCIWTFPSGHSHSAVASPGLLYVSSKASCTQLCFSLSFNTLS